MPVHVKTQLKDLSIKLQTTIQPVFVSRKIGQDLHECETKPQLVNQQCIVYQFKCNLCDTGSYVGYTLSFFVLPILPDQLQEKPSYRKIISLPWARGKTQGCFGDSRINFIARKNFPNADWLSDLRTQLKAFVGGVCLRSNRFFLALFSQINFFTRSRHFKELQLKGNFFDWPQILTVARLTYSKQKHVCELFASKYFFSESDFCTITSHFLNPILKNVL